MTQSEAVLLSLLGPRPVFWYNDKHDVVLCAWNGIIMTQKHALMLASEMFWSQGPTPEMKRVADKDFYTLYHSGAFENSNNWNAVVENTISNIPGNSLHNYYRRKLEPFIQKNLSSEKPETVFKWFNLGEFVN